ncbi:MAG TPA: acyltransferase family protein [Acidobacteriaceae bacterium]|jgi:peptidoglycan/LPS O-acetylase OafA/YrhL|nr:acyltransferase family protein [Acidobacteriaceae bacterium]
MSAGETVASRREGKLHRRDIDGLRSIAVLSVLGFHCRVPGVGGGFAGVDIFFAISGYLICGLVVRDLDLNRFSIAHFYERRCKRILPALFAVLLFIIVTAMLITSPYEAHKIGEDIMAVAASVSNFLFYKQGNYFGGGGTLNPLLMTWSLAVEEQFYIVFPLLMMLLYKQSRKSLFATLSGLCLLSLAASVYMEFHHPEFNFYSPFTRAWEIGAGTLLAFYEARRPSHLDRPLWLQHLASWLGLALILATITFYTQAVRFPGYEAIPPVLGTILLLGNRRGGANRLLSLQPFVAIGLISYSLYLWHWPLLSFAALVSPVPLTAANRAVLMLLAFPAAILSYFLIERPFRRYVPRKTSRLLLAYASCSVCLLTVGGVLDFSKGIPQRAPQLALVESSLDLDREHRCVTMSDTKINMSPDCVPASSSALAMALLGDSHAEAMEEPLKQYAASIGDQLLTLTMPACPPLQGVTRFSANEPLFASQCAAFNRRTLEIVASRPDVKTVVLAGSWPMAPEDMFLPTGFQNDPLATTAAQHGRYLIVGMQAEIKALESLGKQVILIEDNPSVPFNPLSRYRYRSLPLRRAVVDILLRHPVEDAAATSVPRRTTLNTEAEQVRKEMLAMAHNDPQLTVIDTKSLFCDSAQCTISDGNDLYYVDNNHFSRFGEAKVVASIAAAGTKPTADSGK